ncbi:hypothetical protein N431DRAFT_403883 [Stipitochalara longipes BDJ]|nr:hypothetical protein N431DRAFT_403883 [Stipitochalara longipes BDJ]
MWNQISCPACTFEKKISLLPDESIRRYADQATWERHELLVARHALQDNPNFVWCLSGKCEWGELHNPKSKRFICPACGFQTCFKHQIPWHEGLTCRQYDGLDEPPRSPKPKKNPGLKDALRILLHKLTGKPKQTKAPVVVDSAKVLEAQKTAALMKEASRQRGQSLKTWAAMGKLSKKCPGRGCGVPIERASGCSRMRCGRCGCDFCFTCLSLWANGHYESCNDVNGLGYAARITPRNQHTTRTTQVH